MKHSELLEKIEALEVRVEVLEKKAAAGTTTIEKKIFTSTLRADFVSGQKK
ncbi:hypothetical protein [Planococcus wigleyi]|uniref:Transposase n=1 Tax=Planococcus wigleyi TaxID=2762216 RepID=A0ABR8W9Z4_9BACL|nr:hypothetical protein [Planococcus wigleyi]MBD8013848.1 hypothetical protein [Planococcus wigleyi]